MKSFYRYRKNVYARERSQRVPLKKRKLSDHSFAVSYDQDVSSDSISNLPEKGVMGDKGNLAMVLHRGRLSYLLFEKVTVSSVGRFSE